MSNTKSILLTIEQKIEAYKWVKNRILSCDDSFVCSALKRWLKKEEIVKGWLISPLVDYFPEWYTKKPEKQLGFGVWFKSDTIRLQALDEVIEELEEKLKNEIK